jgi:hypothetical protein
MATGDATSCDGTVKKLAKVQVHPNQEKAIHTGRVSKTFFIFIRSAPGCRRRRSELSQRKKSK